MPQRCVVGFRGFAAIKDVQELCRRLLRYNCILDHLCPFLRSFISGIRSRTLGHILGYGFGALVKA